MLKIAEYKLVIAEDGKSVKREKVNLTILENFGFKKFPNGYFKKVYLANDADDRVCYRIDNNRNIKITRLDGELDNTLYDLIQAGLVEKVEEK